MTERKESVEIWQLVARGIFVLAALYCIRRYEAGWFSLPAISVWNVCLAVGIWLLVGELFRASKRLKIYSIIGGAVPAIAMVAGRGISDTDAIGVLIHPLRNCLLSLCSVLVFTVLLAAFACLLIRLAAGKAAVRQWKIGNILRMRFSFFGVWVWIFVTWIPCYLAYYPGIFSYDMPEQHEMAAAGFSFYHKGHPPIHTLLWALCLKIGEATGIRAITVYSVLQMLLLSAALSAVVMFLVKKGMPDLLSFLAILFFSINPVVAIMAITPVKDVPFAAFMILTAVELFRLADDPAGCLGNKMFYLRFGIVLCLACLFRLNAIYVYVLTGVGALILLKGLRRRALAAFLLPLLVYLIIEGPVCSALGMMPGNKKEMLSVPIQQLSRVVALHGDELSKEERKEIGKFLPVKGLRHGLYNPRLADPVKVEVKESVIREDLGGFLKLWWKYLSRYPDDYVNAFLSLNLPYWFPDAATPDPYSQRDYIETEIYYAPSYNFERTPILPGLYAFYEKAADYSLFDGIPLVDQLFSITTPLWVLWCCVMILLYARKYNRLMVMMPYVFLHLTYLLGPVSNFRYVFPIFLAYPVLAAAVVPGHFCQPKRKGKG